MFKRVNLKRVLEQCSEHLKTLQDSLYKDRQELRDVWRQNGNLEDQIAVHRYPKTKSFELEQTKKQERAEQLEEDIKQLEINT